MDVSIDEMELSNLLHTIVVGGAVCWQIWDVGSVELDTRCLEEAFERYLLA